MTEEELDLIASAYADGEATPEEVAMVERDPELMARVEEIRLLSQQLSAPISVPTPAMKEQHLTAALGEFSSLGGDAAPAPPTVKVDRDTLVDRQGPGVEPAPTQRGNVVELAGRSSRSGSSQADAPKTFPRWLSAAAAFVVLGGGAAFLVSQSGGSDNSTDTALVEFDADEQGETEAESAGQGAARADSDFAEDAVAASPADEATEEDSMDDSAMGDEAMEDEAMEEEAMDESGGDAAESGPATTSTAATAPAEPESGGSNDAEDGSTTGGFFPNQPAMSFDELPEVEQALAEMPRRRSDLFRSVCTDSVAVPAGFEIVAFLPIEVAGEPAELFVLADANGTETGVILDGTCSQM